MPELDAVADLDALSDRGTGRGVLSVPAFRRVWIGATISAAGDAGSWVAIVTLALGQGHASLPLVVVLYTAPVAVGGLVAGWALDRFDRRRVMIADSLIRGAAFSSIPIAIVAGHLGAWLLYSVAAVYGFFKMVGLAGFPSLIPALVSEQQLDQANALEGVSYGLATLTGAGLAGLAVTSVGPAWVIALDAVSYIVMALCLWSIPASHRAAGIREPGSRQRTSVAAVIRLCAANAIIRDTTVMFAVFNVGEGMLLVFLPHRAVQLGLGASGYGYLVAATTTGELLAALLLSRLTWRRSLAASIILAQGIAAAVTLTLLVPNIATTVAALVILGGCAAPMTAWAQSLRMRLVDPALHGRLFAALRTMMQATPPLGGLLAALTLEAGTVPTVLAVVAAMGAPVALLGPHLVRATASSTGQPNASIGSR